MDSLRRKYSPVADLRGQDTGSLGSIYGGKFLYKMNYYMYLLVIEKYSTPGRQSQKTVTNNVTFIEKHLVSPVG
jgi:hypothetical protein